ncbi:MAG: hypothetical protein IPO39_15605 [Bacteroidetes bacterium]|nr:hypothetical protein [Bacteroidota bacterium]
MATPKNSRLVDAYLNQTGTLLDIKGRYLVRDVVKVTGSECNGLVPATIGIFFVKAHDPESGQNGTYAMRVCRQHGGSGNNAGCLVGLDVKLIVFEATILK